MVPEISGNIDQTDAVGGGQFRDGSRRRAGYNKGRLDLAVLQGLLGILKGLILGLNILQGDSRAVQDVQGVKVNAGPRFTDGNGFAPQILHALNGIIHGDQLYRLRVQASQDTEIVGRAVLFKGSGPVPAIGHDVRLSEAQLEIAVLDTLDVDLGSAGRYGRYPDAGVGFHILCQDASIGIIGAGRSAGTEHHPVRRIAASAETEHHYNDHDGAQPFHYAFSFHLLLTPLLYLHLSADHSQRIKS